MASEAVLTSTREIGPPATLGLATDPPTFFHHVPDSRVQAGVAPPPPCSDRVAGGLSFEA